MKVNPIHSVWHILNELVLQNAVNSHIKRGVALLAIKVW